MSEKPDITAEFTPAWKRGVRLRFDEARDQWVIVSPERVSMLNQTATEILKLVDGRRTIQAIVDDLAARFNAPKELILKDVTATLTDLRNRGLLA